MRLIKLGISELDDSLGGGFPHPSLASVEGDHGSGKTVLTQQIVYAMLRAGLRVWVIASETTIKEYLSGDTSIERVVIVLFDDEAYRIFSEELR